MLTTYRFQLNQNEEQEILLAKHFGCCRLIYNYMLSFYTNEEYNKDKSVKWMEFKYQSYITELKKQEDFKFLKSWHSFPAMCCYAFRCRF